MRSITFEGDTWERYEELRNRDKVLHKTLCRLLVALAPPCASQQMHLLCAKEMRRGNPATGTGKPEPRKHGLSGLWSRRLSLKDRLIYRFDDEHIYVFAIGG
ncbi:MAG: type II toxin-antitoxin system YoeB family toxin [Deltaproteobacteria bacterium]|nr:type II toxin-antitoxin system YoeB family toxin [Deltaproteobacteria bacterium]